jgi:hypothetical protein
MSNYILGDLTTGNDFILLAVQQGPQGASGALAQVPINSITGPATANLAWFSINEVTCTGGLVTLNFTAASAGSILWVKFLAGSPATHNIVMTPPSGKSIEGVLGAYNSAALTVPGTYYSSGGLTWQTATDVGSAMAFYQNSGGNIATSPF